MILNDNIQEIKNIGDIRVKKLNKLNIFTVKDLIEYFPREYDDRSNIKKINEFEFEKENTVKGKVCFKPETIKLKGITLTKVKIEDETGFFECIWYNQPYIKNNLKIKGEYLFTGKVINKFNRIQMESPDYELIENKELLSNGRIVPVYTSTYKFSQKLFREIIFETLNLVNSQITEILPKTILNKYKLCDRKFAIQNIHFPKDYESYFLARKRLVFEELFLLQMRLLQLKGVIESKSSTIFFDNIDFTEIKNKFEFDLTNAQEKVLNEIINDFKNKKTMNRLIQGDVGCGKTAIAIICSYIAVKNGYQVALMVPTDVLAKQHLIEFTKIFNGLDINIEFLSGNLTKKQKTNIYSQINNGDINIVIGTHALIQDGVIYNNLGLVITDEQHRFGVRQRNILSEKGNNPHTLVMTATPIPRTLALILYGDLSISIIDELPPGRQIVDTLVVSTSYYPRIFDFIKKNADKGFQTYIICSTIEDSENKELKAVISYTEKLKTEIFQNYTVECVHGKMKNDLKIDIMDKFSKGKIDILISTTVIEVGINIPNATIIIIENAERFGIAQLHQLRGRVGRGNEKSYCVLVSNSKSKVSISRLKTMKESNDGFILSEKDLSIRGPGDFFGTRQHGIPEMKIANLYKDIEILKLVQKASAELFLKDPELILPEHTILKNSLNLLLCKNLHSNL